MASMDFDATDMPTDIVATLGLTDGTRYTVQNVDLIATLRLRQSATVPDADSRSHKVEAGASFIISPTSGEAIYVWSELERCAAIVTEAV